MCIFTIYPQSCKERSGVSSITIMKYVMKKYPSVEMDKKTKNLYKRALKRLVERGTVKQVICNLYLTHKYFLFYIYSKSKAILVLSSLPAAEGQRLLWKFRHWKGIQTQFVYCLCIDVSLF